MLQQPRRGVEGQPGDIDHLAAMAAHLAASTVRSAPSPEAATTPRRRGSRRGEEEGEVMW